MLVMNNLKEKCLKDIQNQDDKRGIAIQKVGVNDVEVPLTIQRKDAENQVVSAKARMSVSLPEKNRGTHMSRFMEILSLYKIKNLLGIDIKGFLTDIQKKLHAKSAHVRFSFKYFIDKNAPISKLKFPMGYDCSFEGNLDEECYQFILGVRVPVTTLCPCSKEISEYSAHNQRAIVKVKISYDETEHIWLEDLIEIIENCGSCPVYPILKRNDEKFVTEAAYNNPKFVEDVLRDLVGILRKDKRINFFEVEIEAHESIHNHNAWAWQSEVKPIKESK